MLVCVRGVGNTELAKRYRQRIPNPHFERYYFLYTNETNVTLVDVVDSRARKTFNYDVGVNSLSELQENVVEPLLMTVLTPDRASQAVVVVDGLAGNRCSTLMDAVDGVLANTARTAAAHPDVASLSFSAVTLEDNNTLTDILLRDEDGDAAEITILEDRQEQFTSVEDAHYVSLASESAWEAVRQRTANAFAEFKHQIFSFIFSFHPSTGRPNTTIQFVSFTVNEVARGMKSSRHAVSAAAGLIECNSPTLTFTSTKLLFLLKPSLLGQQPGAWVACFSPVSVVEAAEQETFQEAFAIAQTASRLYSSRIALLSTSTTLPPPLQSQPTSAPSVRDASVPAEDAAEGRRNGNDASPPVTPEIPPRPAVPELVHGSQTDTSYLHEDSADVSDRRRAAPHLVQTPSDSPPWRKEAFTSMLMAATSLQPPPPPLPRNQSAGVATSAVQTDAVPAQPLFASSPAAQPRESIQRGPSEEKSAVRYEFETYRAVMERAMARMRADMHHYAKKLEETKAEMQQHHQRNRELRRELEMASESQHATVLENSELRLELAQQQQLYDKKLQELSKSSSFSPPGQVVKEPKGEAASALRDEVELLEVRVAELTELVAFHQSEIKDHVSKEYFYRKRILDLEAALRAEEREVISCRAAAQEARRAVNTAVSQATTVPANATAELSHDRTSSTVLREDMRVVEDRAAEMELHLRTALDELQRERAQRLELENLLKKRETEEVARTKDKKEEAATLTLQQAYEHQLRELRAEMMGFRAQLAQQVLRPLPPALATPSVSNDSSMQVSTPVAHFELSEHNPQQQQSQPQSQPQPPPRPPTPLRLSPMPDGAVRSHLQGDNNTPFGSDQRKSTLASPAKSSRRAQSFEEYMQEEPHYELHRASFLRSRPRLRPLK